MNYKLTKGNASNYQIEVEVGKSELDTYKQKALKHFQKEYEMPGFRKGHVPLDLVEKGISPEYLKAAIYEEIINDTIKKLISEHKDKQFIGNIYDIQPEEKDNKLVIKFKLDVYPQVEEKNKNWQTLKIKKISDRVTKKEIEKVIEWLKKQYAQYQDADIIDKDTVTKFKLIYKNDKWEEIETWTTILGPEDYQEYKQIADKIIWKKKEEEIELDYNEKVLPHVLHSHKAKDKPSKIILIPVDIKKIILPEFDVETLKKLFGQEYKSYEDFENKVKEEVKKAKFEQELIKQIEDYLNKASESFEVQIPKTLIDEEIKARFKSLEQRFGGPAGLEKYLQQIGQEKAQKLYEDISNAAVESLRKFLILQKIVQLLWLENIDWQKPLDVEKKIYEKVVEK